jgi:DNA-directed RNA polymerase subunit RPC12/RpoP
MIAFASMIPPDEPPTARELAGRGGSGAVCPRCGCKHLEVYGTGKIASRIMRYKQCRNPNCGHRFITRQPPEEYHRDVNPHDKKDE